MTILGVSREDSNNSLEAVRTMTAEKGDTMAYTVAWDDEGQTYADWMTAAGQRGIPTSFLVDREGRVAWIGHPMAMDGPLAMVVDGTWDPVESPKALKAMQALQREVAMGARRASKAEAEELLGKLEDFAERWPDQAAGLEQAKYDLLLRAERPDDAAAVGRRLVARAVEAGDSAGLNALAWGIVDPDVEPSSRDLGLALHAATVAANLTGHADPAILDTLARAHFWLGGLDRAIELQRKAVALANEDPKGKAMAASLEVALAEYLAAKG